MENSQRWRRRNCLRGRFQPQEGDVGTSREKLMEIQLILFYTLEGKLETKLFFNHKSRAI